MGSWTPEEEAMFTPILADLERRWIDDGDVGAVAEAISWCGYNGLRLPEWCVEPAICGLGLFAHKGKGKGYSTRASELVQLQKERHRYALVSLHRDFDLAAGKVPDMVAIYKEVAAVLGRFEKGDWRLQNVNWETVQASYLKLKNQAN